MSCYYWFARALIRIYLNTLCRLDCRGRGNIPVSGGFILASNHIAAADPFLLGSTISRELLFMAKKELFKPRSLGFLMGKLNAFPVDRQGFDLESIKKAIAVLERGTGLVMFPEGTRSKDGILQEGKIGVGMLARKVVVPIVPAYLANTKKAWFNLARGKRLIARMGPPMTANWIEERANNKEGYKEITEELMKRIALLGTQVESGG